MAQTIIGLDIGSYSVKVAFLTASFRAVSWTGFREFVIPLEQRERPEAAAAEVLKRLAKDPKSRNAFVVTALPGDQVMTRFVDFPFNDPKRLDAVMGFELENRLPLSVSTMTYTFQVTGQTDEGKTEVFAAACKRSSVGAFLEELSGAGLDPRVITLDTASYLNLYDQLAKEGTVAFVDVGHRATKVCIVQNGRLCTARAIGRGGLAVTRALQQALGADFEAAEAAKHEHVGLGVSHAGGPPPTPLARAVELALGPLVVALRQTFQAFASERKTAIDRVFVTGGGSRIAGFEGWLAEQLGRPVEPLPLEQLEINKVQGLGDEVVGAATSVGLALVQAGASKHRATLDFRRGEFAYAGDFEFLKDRLRSLTAMAAILVIVGSGWAVVKNRGLEKQLADQKAQLAEFTESALGEKMTSFSKALKVVSTPPDDNAQDNLFPPMTAVAILDRITRIQEQMNLSATDGARPTPPGGPADGVGVPRPDNGFPGGAPPMGTRFGARPAQPIDPTASPTGFRTPRPPPGLPNPGTIGPALPRPTAAPAIPPGASAPIGAPGEPGSVDPSGEPGPAAEAPAEPPPPTSKIELSMVDINVFDDVTITAESHESNVAGKELFRQKLEGEPCFKEVKRRDIGEVVSTGRHSDWIRFEVTFKVRCPKPEDVAEGKGKDDAPGKSSEGSDGSDGADGADGAGDEP